MKCTGRGRTAGVATLVLLSMTACSSGSGQDPAAVVIPPAPSASAVGGPGAYTGEAVNAVGTPVPVRVDITPLPTTPPGPDAVAVASFLRRASVALGATAPTLRFVNVTIDNTGEIDAVSMPGNVDVLDATGRGANFRPAYDVARENRELLTPDTALSDAGKGLVQRLLIRDNLVRPGQVVTVPYISTDPLTDVAQVVVNGAVARKAPA